ncbi:MAG TPA: hypothetical protein VFS37_16175 [Conexibacter sp.]|nr:hypothetical protein [Conexibacter sp.]
MPARTIGGGAAAAVRDATAAVEDARPRRLDAGAVAWLGAIPCGLLIAGAILVLGPPLGRLLPQAAPAGAYWPGQPRAPEPVEHARYAIALLGPLLLAGLVLLASARPPLLSARLARSGTALGGLALFALLALCLLAQNSLVLHANVPPAQPIRFFTPATLAAAAAIALLIAAGARRGPATLRALMRREPRAVHVVCFALAAALTATWLLTALNTETTIGNPPGNDLIPWDMAETFAILDGRTPLADFRSQYSQLWPYVGAVALAALGTTIGVWTATMAAISGLALLAVYAVFRRIVRSAVLALALYAPVLATGFFIQNTPDGHPYSLAGIFSAWPLRYAGPYLLAWLIARHCDGAAPRRAWLLFAAAGLVAVNNPEFGLGAFAGAVLALGCVRRVASPRAAARLLGDVAAGTTLALALVALLTFARSGSLPQFGHVLEFSRLYGTDGWFIQPMAPIGLHVAMYVTFGAALVAGLVRAVRGGEEAALTAMLAWIGPFGLAAGSYFVGASNPLTLVTLFSVWFFALALLLVAVVRAVAATRRLPTLPELAVLFGFGLAVCSLPQIPAPWREVERLRRPGPPVYRQAEALPEFRRLVRPGEKVAILMPLGHRIAYDLGVTNVSPYSGPAAMPTKRQLRVTIEAMRREGARRAFVDGNQHPHLIGGLQRAGFAVRGSDNPVELVAPR